MRSAIRAGTASTSSTVRGQVLRVAAPDPAAHELHAVDRSPLLRRALAAHVHGRRLQRRHNTKMMVEDYPASTTAASPGTASRRISSGWARTRGSCATTTSSHRASPTSSPRVLPTELGPGHDPLSPPLTPETAPGAAQRVRHAGAGGRLAFNIGRRRDPSTGGRRPARRGRSASTPRSSLRDDLGREIRSLLRPGRRRRPLLDEIKAWDPNLSPHRSRTTFAGSTTPATCSVRSSLRTARMTPSSLRARRQRTSSSSRCASESPCRDLLAVYYIPGMGHGGAPYDASLGAQLDALEAWVTYARAAAPPALRPLIPSW